MEIPSLINEFGTRLVTLCDGRPGLRCALEIQSLNAPSSIESTSQHPVSSIQHQALTTPPILEFIASTEALDRYEEILSAAGWRLDHYRRNPVFQNAHQYGDIIFTLGKALITEVRQVAGRPALYQKIEFAVDANPMARIAYALYKGKFLNAVSVGFIPIRWQNGDRGFSSLPSERQDVSGETSAVSPLLSEGRAAGGGQGLEARGEGSDGSPRPSDGRGVRGEGSGYHRKYLEQELLEVSAVGIPANPEALALGLKSGAVDKSDLRELLTLLQHSLTPPLQHSASGSLQHPLSEFRSGTAAPNPHSSAPGIRNNGAQLLQLAHALRALLRRF